MMKTTLAFAVALCFQSSLAETISDINGDRFLSPYAGKTVTNVSGLVTAKGPSGFWLRSTTPDSDPRTSESIYVYGSSAVSSVAVGDIITLDGKVSEYRSSSAYVPLTEITSPSNIKVLSSGNAVEAVVIGENAGLSPPTEQFSSLDNGDVFGLPNNASLLSDENPVLQPSLYGMDFWESLSGELVTLVAPRAISKPNSYGDTWVIGQWNSTGENQRGGLTMSDRDANPEAIVIMDPLDGTKNPLDTKLGDNLEDITGVLTQVYGFYTVLPLTALMVLGSRTPATPAATELVSDGTCSTLTFGSYNVENLAPDSAHLPKIADHIANYLKSPALVFLQEIQDDSGPTDDGVTSANKTLSTLTAAIESAGGVSYSFIDIAPLNNQDGGEPGGNIRVAYLYDASVIRLRNPNPGSSTDANDIILTASGPELKYNPGRIDPENAAAWTDSRKPLAAEWETLDGRNKFFTINVHFMSKGGSSSLEGDPRPPVNGGVETRMTQADVVANFTSTLLSLSPDAKILVAGDFNEFAFAPPLKHFLAASGLRDLDDVAGVPPTERYTYLYDMNCQALDHVFVSEGVAAAGAKVEHVHVNTWVEYDAQASDHDPSVGVVSVCE
ncbi:endonuclease/exonuclease/phosphatase family protein [Thermoascus aurantiacus ATCC 26904]